MSYSLNRLYQVAGLSKQAVHDYQARQRLQQAQLDACLTEVDMIRDEHPGCGLQSLYEELNPRWIGRDRFCELLALHGYQLFRKPARKSPTRSGDKYYPNLIEAMYVDRPDRVWQSDITYFKVAGRYYYLTFIMDVYTRMIVGYYASDNLRAEANMMALSMALNRREHTDFYRLIHHSDRGSQYRDAVYLAMLINRGIGVSMACMAQDNAYVERLNHTIKSEYLTHWSISTYPELKQAIDRAVTHYNTKRRHSSLGKLSPEQFEQMIVNDHRVDNPKQIIYSTQTSKLSTTSISMVQAVDFPFCIL